MSFVAVVAVPGHVSRRLTFERAELKIGSDPGNDVVVPDAARWHAQLFVRNGELVIADLRRSGTYVNGAPIDGLTPLDAERDVVAIGSARIRFEPDDETPTNEWGAQVTPVFEPVEARLLDALGEDSASYEVYADWLEQRGDHVRAELLRVRHALVLAPEHDAVARRRLRTRLRQLAALVSYAWVARVAPELEDDVTMVWERPDAVER
ncbi:MAG: TIGR02996 domain-containing protein [Deltaproteobacteria bacterium]|nr:TIGR02996 domain-containing protein [Deltaproteobacteria bacterium]MCW5802623.1 TIGR02996 domain-containing protein [Deltaproteobacteria bacterium]